MDGKSEPSHQGEQANAYKRQRDETLGMTGYKQAIANEGQRKSHNCATDANSPSTFVDAARLLNGGDDILVLELSYFCLSFFDLTVQKTLIFLLLFSKQCRRYGQCCASVSRLPAFISNSPLLFLVLRFTFLLA